MSGPVVRGGLPLRVRTLPAPGSTQGPLAHRPIAGPLPVMGGRRGAWNTPPGTLGHRQLPGSPAGGHGPHGGM